MTKNTSIPTEMKTILWTNITAEAGCFKGAEGFKSPFSDAIKMTAGLNFREIYFINL